MGLVQHELEAATLTLCGRQMFDMPERLAQGLDGFHVRPALGRLLGSAGQILDSLGSFPGLRIVIR